MSQASSLELERHNSLSLQVFAIRNSESRLEVSKFQCVSIRPSHECELSPWIVSHESVGRNVTTARRAPHNPKSFAIRLRSPPSMIILPTKVRTLFR